MERMEVECAGATGGALRRSNSAPMITSVSDRVTVHGSVPYPRFRRSSVSINPSCPSQLSPPSFHLSERTPQKQEESLEVLLRGSQQRPGSACSSGLVPVPSRSQWQEHAPTWLHDGGTTPNSSPSPTRRFRPTVAVRWQATPLKRKGGAESDGPPKKLFVAGVTDTSHCSNSVSPAEGASQGPTDAFVPHQNQGLLSPPAHDGHHC
ncbi:uncharacterized protein ACB058_016874 [Synchiropus picturatus]